MKLIQSEITEKRKELYRKNYTELKKSMCANVDDFDYVMRLYEKFCKATISYNLTPESIKRDCFDLASAICFSYFQSVGETASGRLDELMKTITYTDSNHVCEKTKTFLFSLYGKDRASMNETISQVIRYIEEHLTEEVSVTTIAEHFYITPNYLSRLFKKIVGEGCSEYIIRKRIERAKHLLETTDIRTGKIAGMVGYHDINYFSMAFKKYTGKSPTKYREELQ